MHDCCACLCMCVYLCMAKVCRMQKRLIAIDCWKPFGHFLPAIKPLFQIISNNHRQNLLLGLAGILQKSLCKMKMNKS